MFVGGKTSHFEIFGVANYFKLNKVISFVILSFFERRYYILYRM